MWPRKVMVRSWCDLVWGWCDSANSWQGSAQLSPPSPPPSEFCTDEDNSVIRSAMDALRYSKKYNYPSKCNLSLLIHFFQFDFVCTTYIYHVKMFLKEFSFPFNVCGGKRSPWQIYFLNPHPGPLSFRRNCDPTRGSIYCICCTDSMIAKCINKELHAAWNKRFHWKMKSYGWDDLADFSIIQA